MSSHIEDTINYPLIVDDYPIMASPSDIKRIRTRLMEHNGHKASQPPLGKIWCASFIHPFIYSIWCSSFIHPSIHSFTKGILHARHSIICYIKMISKRQCLPLKLCIREYKEVFLCSSKATIGTSMRLDTEHGQQLITNV